MNMAKRKKKIKTKGLQLRPRPGVYWKKGQPLPKELQDEVERQVEEYNKEEEEKADDRLKHYCGPKMWNVTEILYAVTGYLTTRKLPLIFSANHNAGPIAEVLGAIVKANGLPDVRDGAAWPEIDVPNGVDHVTNDPAMSRNKVADPPPTIEEAITKLRQVIVEMTPRNQELAIHGFLNQLYTERMYEVHHQSQVKAHCDKDMEKATRNLENFQRLISLPAKFTGGGNG